MAPVIPAIPTQEFIGKCKHQPQPWPDSAEAMRLFSYQPPRFISAARRGTIRALYMEVPHRMNPAPWLIRNLPTVPLKRLVWSLVRRRQFDFVATTRFGHQFHGNTRDFIQRYLYYFGVWEPSISAWIERTLQPGDVFIDVGANIGYYTMLAARLAGPQGKVVAVEAQPDIYQSLVAHVQLNEISNVRLINQAAAEAPGKVTLYFGGADNIGSTSMLPGTNAEGQTVTVDAHALSQMLTPDECSQARIIKIDVEGAELEVVRGLNLGSGRYRSDVEIVVEVSCERWADGGTRAAAFIEYMRGFGFNAYVLENEHRFHQYLPEAVPKRAVRLNGPLLKMSDVVFSRSDAESL